MGIYIATMILVIVASTIALIYILKKNNLMNYLLIAAITLSSAVLCLAMPFIILRMNAEGLKLLPAILVIIPLYITVVLVLTVALSLFMTDKRAKGILDAMKNSAFVKAVRSIPANAVQAFKNKNVKPDAQQANEEMDMTEPPLAAAKEEERPSEAEIKDVFQTISQQETDTTNSDAVSQEAEKDFPVEEGENIIEKSVDTEQIIDKMGIENVEEDKAYNNVNDYIDQAFRLKEAGDLEGAILHYMYALDSNPPRDVVFWIVLDTCVLYKELGQIEFAKQILESYVSAYGDVMSLSVRTEIERNLSNNEL